MRSRGLTLIEALVVLAVLAAVAAAFAGRWTPAYGFAREYAAATAAARHRAIVEGRAVALDVVPCAAGAPVGTGLLAAVVVAFPRRGLLFTPDGLPRTCDGGGVGNATILLEHRGRRAAVIVSSLGRVRWEPR